MTVWDLRKGDLFDPRLLVWIEDVEALKRLRSDIHAAEYIAFDVETTGLYEHAVTGGRVNDGIAARVVMATFTLVPHSGEDVGEPTTYVLPLSHPDSVWVGKWRKVLTIVAGWLKGKNLWAHHGKFDSRYIYAATGVDLADSLHWDSMASCVLLDENDVAKLKPRAAKLFEVEEWYDAPLNKPGAAEHVPYYNLGLYAARDTYWTYRLTRAHRYLMWVDGRAEDESPLDEGDPDELLLARLGEVAVHVAMPTVRTLARLEQRGIGLDRESTQKRLDEALAESERLKSALVSAYADVEGLEPEKASFAPTSKWFMAFTSEAVKRGDLEVVSMTAAGKPQWNKKVLNKLARNGHSLAATMLEQRVHEKQAQFLESWLDKVTPSGEIHSTYNTDRVVTGRLSCVSPDTLIDMPRDMSKYPDGVPIKDVKEGDFVYSFDHHMRLTLRRVSWVGPTKTAPTIIVTFQNSVGDTRQLTCTPDHLIRLYSGDYRHAGYLMRNGRTPRVLGMVRRGYRDASQRDAYVKFFPNSNARQDKHLWGEEDLPPERDGGRAMEHRWVVEQVNYALHGVPLERRWDVNHIDGNKTNNHPSNLEYMPGWLHRRQTHFDGTRGKEQPGTTAYSGPTDWRPVDIQEGPIMEVWDMTVPFDHCFVANGIVVHNSSNPNMQQVARELKPAFVPRPGYVMMEADYSQIELRVAAMVSGCSPMIEAFQRGDDLHRLFGARLANRDRLEDVTAEERQKAKSANFGLLYGMGAEGFQAYAEDAYGVEMSLAEAFQVHRAFFEMWPGLTDWHAAQRNFAFRHGYVISPIGRVRRLPKIWSSNRQLAGEAERQAINAPVQGLGSDIMQIAASSIEGTLAGHSAVKGANIVATVHDSIEVELQEDRWEEVARECLDRMTEGVIPVLERLGMEVTVPLAAEAAVGYTWGDHSIGQFMSG